VKSVEVLWESFGTDEMPNVGDLIASVSYKNGYIRFSTPENFRDGNAVIAAKNSKGTILWSWHIWCAEEGWQEQVYYNDAGTMMDRNLGATSATPGDVGALGLMYQWGRKDPFMGSSSIKYAVDESSSIEYAVFAVSTGAWNTASGDLNFNNPIQCTEAEKNPTTFYALWLPKVGWMSTKTAYDPCPAGWRVPDGGENGVWAKALGTSANVSASGDSTNKGINFTGKFGEAETIWYPATGSLAWGNNGAGAFIFSLINVGYTSSIWSCSLSYYDNTAYCLHFNTTNTFNAVAPSNYDTQYYGLPVRCLKETD
jgi:uncharacterized protein (TIGR02145 family)